MSCITIIGRERVWNQACDVPLPRSAPEWTRSKLRRLERLASSDLPYERAVAAAHPRTPAHTLVELLTDEVSTVRRAAIKNPNVTEHMIHLALQDADLGIVAYAKLFQED